MSRGVNVVFGRLAPKAPRARGLGANRGAPLALDFCPFLTMKKTKMPDDPIDCKDSSPDLDATLSPLAAPCASGKGGQAWRVTRANHCGQGARERSG